MFKFFRDDKIIEGEALRIILNEVVTPCLAKYGFKWNGDNKWSREQSEDKVDIVEYKLLKGGCGTFVWGVWLKFIPIITSDKVQYVISSSKMKLDLFEWIYEYANSFFGGNIDNGISNHGGYEGTKKSIDDLLKRNELKIIDWFNESGSIQDLIKMAERQIKIGSSYNLHNPSPNLALLCLYAKIGEKEKSDFIITNLNIAEVMKQKLKRKLSTI